MTQYNIIYTSPAQDHYLWNGARFKKLLEQDRVSILYSNPSFLTEDLNSEFAKCRANIRKNFPNDKEPRLNKIGIHISNKQTERPRQNRHFEHMYN